MHKVQAFHSFAHPVIRFPLERLAEGAAIGGLVTPHAFQLTLITPLAPH